MLQVIFIWDVWIEIETIFMKFLIVLKKYCVLIISIPMPGHYLETYIHIWLQTFQLQHRKKNLIKKYQGLSMLTQKH